MRYRYQSPVLHGPWRDTREQAIADAIRAGQAERGADGSLIWRDRARLEEDAGGAATELVRPKF